MNDGELCPNCGEEIEDVLFSCEICGNAICIECANICKKCGDYFCDSCYVEHTNK
ncbi:MAG: hypothetical protein GF383_16430 [Candidatus Lokiarchaeota archaeon]|nr:hypothetical protein [Candidatus Lokiarchaeota archaeon]MBD3343348.1 hypothetical protein [Candidatus Lokiarchaeota archaeon]